MSQLLQRARAFLASHPWAHTAVLCALCLMLGLLIGRARAPVHVHEETQVHETEKVQEVQVQREIAHETKAAAVTVVVHRVVERTVRPGGETVERTTEDVSAGEHHETALAEAHEEAQERVEYRDRVVEKVVDKAVERPPWRLTGLVGMDVHEAGRVIYGGGLERRLFGPFAAGAWGLSNGTAGVAVSVEW